MQNFLKKKARSEKPAAFGECYAIKHHSKHSNIFSYEGFKTGFQLEVVTCFSPHYWQNCYKKLDNFQNLTKF